MKKIIYIIITIFLLFILTSCKKPKQESKNQYQKMYFEYFDTVVTIIGYEKNEDLFKEKLQIIEPLLKKYHHLYDIYYEYNGINNICTINKKAYINPIVVDQEIINLIKYSKSLNKITNNMFNIAMGSVLKLWHDEREYASEYPYDAKLPDREALANASKYMNIEDIIIDEENSTVFIKNEYTKLDVGAIAKGYACEQIAKELFKTGTTSYIINLGGNIKLLGSKNEKENFVVGVQNPIPGDSSVIQKFSLANYSVVTSGSYQRYYTVDNVNYHHIINPKTLMPANYYLSVTVIAKDSGLCDALSTALFNMTIEEGTKIISTLDDIYVMWVDSNKQIIYSKGLEEKIA